MTDEAGGGCGGLGGWGSGWLGMPGSDPEDSVRRMTLDTLFLKTAEPGQLIRENPLARTPGLVQEVSGVFGN
jgi:hypothetical protein